MTTQGYDPNDPALRRQITIRPFAGMDAQQLENTPLGNLAIVCDLSLLFAGNDSPVPYIFQKGYGIQDHGWSMRTHEGKMDAHYSSRYIIDLAFRMNLDIWIVVDADPVIKPPSVCGEEHDGHKCTCAANHAFRLHHDDQIVWPTITTNTEGAS